MRIFINFPNIADFWGSKSVQPILIGHEWTYIWSPGLIFGATCTISRAGADPGAPGARRGPQGAETRQKAGAGFVILSSLRSRAHQVKTEIVDWLAAAPACGIKNTARGPAGELLHHPY